MFYSTAQEVIEYTGVSPFDVGVDDSEELTSLIESWLLEIKDIIDADRRRDFLQEADGDPTSVRKLVHNVAKRMAANMVALAILRRETPIIKMDDFTVQLVQDQVMTKDIRRDLNLIPRGISQRAPFRVWRIRREGEIDAS